jgi:hypothetical protein
LSDIPSAKNASVELQSGHQAVDDTDWNGLFRIILKRI